MNLNPLSGNIIQLIHDDLWPSSESKPEVSSQLTWAPPCSLCENGGLGYCISMDLQCRKWNRNADTVGRPAGGRMANDLESQGQTPAASGRWWKGDNPIKRRRWLEWAYELSFLYDWTLSNILTSEFSLRVSLWWWSGTWGLWWSCRMTCK